VRPQGGPEVHEAYDIGYRDGRANGFDESDMRVRLLRALAAIVAIIALVLGGVAWYSSVQRSNEYENGLMLACADEGGIWLQASKTCAWTERAR